MPRPFLVPTLCVVTQDPDAPRRETLLTANAAGAAKPPVPTQNVGTRLPSIAARLKLPSDGRALSYVGRAFGVEIREQVGDLLQGQRVQ
jgi:hypothetical protein